MNPNDPNPLAGLIPDEIAKEPEPDKQSLALEFNSVEGFHPLDLRHLNAGDFSVLIGVLMSRLGAETVTITDEERTFLDAPEGFCTVLKAEINPDTQEVRLTVVVTKASEFRS